MSVQSKIRVDGSRIDAFLERLATGNRKSIHLNAVPGRLLNRLDLDDLSLIDNSLPEAFMRKLYGNKSFSFPISFRNMSLGESVHLNQLEKRLNRLVDQSREYFLEFGQQIFGFGYPLLIKHNKEDRTKIIKAPLIIWNLAIERSRDNKNGWCISRKIDAPLKVNELLRSHIRADEGLQLPQLPDEVMEDDLITSEQLLNFCNAVLHALGSSNKYSNLNIRKCPDVKALESMHYYNNEYKTPWIQHSGVFGLYNAPKEAIIKATEELKQVQNMDEGIYLESNRVSTIASIDTDPSQNQIVNTLDEEEIKLIQGPPGTGKSQSITAIISNALANKRTCLVICEKKVASQVLYDNLEALGLDDLAIVIDDVNRDRSEIIKKSRYIHQQTRQVDDINCPELETKLQSFTHTKHIYNHRHKETLKQILGDKSRKDLIGHLLNKENSSTNLDNVAEQLRDLKMYFNQEEYTIIIEYIRDAQVLYSKIAPQTHKIFVSPSRNFLVDHPNYTTTMNNDVMKAIDNCANVAQGICDFLDNQKSRKQDFSLITNYLATLTEKQLCDLKQYVEQLLATLKDISDSLESFLVDNPKITYNMLKNRKIWPVVGVWSSRNKAIDSQRKYLRQEYSSLDAINNSINDFGYKFINFDQYRNLNSLEDFRVTNNLIQQNAKNLQTGLQDALKIKDYLHQQSHHLQNIINNVYFFRISDTVSIPETIIDLRDVENQYNSLARYFDECRKYFNEFEDWYHWQLFLNNCDAISRTVLHILVDSQLSTERWAKCFESWYYREVLLRHEESSGEGFHTSDDQLDKLCSLDKDLMYLQLQQMKNIWNAERNKAFSALPKKGIMNFNTFYNLRGSKNQSRTPLLSIIKQDFSLFTSLFPVILTNPSVACTLFTSRFQAFDYVIFDEASQLRIEDTFASLLLGKRKIISGDKHQMPPSSYFSSESTQIDSESPDDDSFDYAYIERKEQTTSESLLQYAETLMVDKRHKSYLDYHYRSQHPSLIAFSNAAIYGDNLVPMPARKDYCPIDFQHIGGIYYDSSYARHEKNTNREEALEVLRILREDIQPLQQGGEIYPSVGIVTFNIHQRDLIYDLVNKESRENDEFAEKLHILNESDFFIRSLENVQGDERDIIIISTTFGRKPDGSFRQNFGHINYKHGYKLLNVLVTRAKHKLYIRTSVPEEYYKKMPEEGVGIEGRNFFYAYLYYCSLLVDGQMKQIEQLLGLLRKKAPEEPRNLQSSNLTESVFEEEVYQELKQFLPESEIKAQFPVGGFKLDFLIRENIALECDGKAYHSSEEAYKHDMYRQRELEKLGFVFYRIWSTSWFRDKEGELKQLLNFINGR